MTSVRVPSLRKDVDLATRGRLLDAFLSEDVDVVMACGGRGICATCHVFVRKGMEQLTPRTEREQRTLSRLTGARPESRLACQCHVLGPGVEADLPSGTYVTSYEGLVALVGKRTAEPIRHPLDGRILIQARKIITRSALDALRDVDFSLSDVETL